MFTGLANTRIDSALWIYIILPANTSDIIIVYHGTFAHSKALISEVCVLVLFPRSDWVLNCTPFHSIKVQSHYFTISVPLAFRFYVGSLCINLLRC
ncbi:hypothetical protein FKM82_001026 [Ascaphus truei]